MIAKKDGSARSKNGIKRRAPFITFEGPDGAGKTTHAKRLKAELEAAGEKVLLTREPGGSHFGERIRDILLDPETGKISPITELLMYESIRAHHIETVIRPSIENGIIVISDRFTDASVAYQGFGRGIQIATVDTLNEIATSGLRPDVTIMLDVDPAEGLRGVKARSTQNAAKNKLDRIEAAGAAFHRRVRQGYLKLAFYFADRIAYVKRSDDLDATYAAIRAELVSRSKYVAAALSERA